MKTIPLLILGIFLSTALLLISKSSIASTSNFNSPVKASDYCTFLNQAAVNDPDHLYDAAMSITPEAACIVRVGAPGSWHYEVIAGRENFPITYLNEPCKEAYCNSAQKGTLIADDQNEDPFLRSNKIFFTMTRLGNETENLALSQNNNSSSISSWINENTIVGTLFLIGVVSVFGEPLFRSDQPYDASFFIEQDQLARKRYVDDLAADRIKTPNKKSSYQHFVTAEASPEKPCLTEEKREQSTPPIAKYQAIDKRLAFLTNQNERENINQQLQRLLGEEEKGKSATVRVLKKILENGVRRLECDQRVKELDNQHDTLSSEKLDLINRYNLLKAELSKSNDQLGIMLKDRLAYAWEQQGVFTFTDPHNVAPWLTRGMGIALKAGLIVPWFLVHNTVNNTWFYGSYSALFYKVLVTAGVL